MQDFFRVAYIVTICCAVFWTSSTRESLWVSSKSATAISLATPIKQSPLISPMSGDRTKQMPNGPGYILAKRYDDSKDRRTFLSEALAQAEAGGVYLAQRVVSECMLNITPTTNNASTIQKHIGLIPKNAENYATRVQAVKHLLEPCLGFDASPVQSADLKALLASVDVTKDPVLALRTRARNALDKNGDLTELPAIIQKAKEAGTPYALSETLVQITAASANFNGYTISVDGKPVTIRNTCVYICRQYGCMPVRA